MAVLPASTDILIVGAGPTGLALANALRHLGLDPLLIDRQAEGANTSRAAVVHARTLEVLEPLGITAKLLANGIKVPLFSVRDGSRTLAEVSFADLKTAYPFTLMIPQDTTEAILLGHLAGLGGAVVRPAQATAIRPREDGADLDIALDGETTTVATKWLIGCDGMHSVVREAAGISFEGSTYPEDFILADVHMDWPVSREEVVLFFSTAGFIMVAPLPGEDRYRIVGTVDSAPAEPDTAYVQALMDQRGIAPGVAKVRDTVWSSRFRIHHRVAATPRAGRLLLCGDAAHVHSPAGGQGMNTGIQDAVSLAAPLAAAIRGDASGLDEWAQARHRVAERVVDITDKMTRAAALSSVTARRVRNIALTLVGHIPALREAIAQRLSELDNR